MLSTFFCHYIFSLLLPVYQHFYQFYTKSKLSVGIEYSSAHIVFDHQIVIIKGFRLCKMTLSVVSLLLRLPSYLIDHSGNNSSLIKTYLDTSWASVNQEKLDVERTPPTPLIGADEETVPLSSCLLRISGNQRLAGL